jgi:4-carboxymuconolactone decarboxylase
MVAAGDKNHLGAGLGQGSAIDSADAAGADNSYTHANLSIDRARRRDFRVRRHKVSSEYRPVANDAATLGRRNPWTRSPQMPVTQTAPAREQVRPIAPKLVELAEQVVYGEVWERPGLSKRDRSLITVATLVALGREKQLVGHLGRALDNGISREELGELFTHLAFYAGWPAAMTAALVAKDVFAGR